MDHRHLLKPSLNIINFDTPHRDKVLGNSEFPRHQEILGSGAYGVVFKAAYRSKNVAVKLILEQSKPIKMDSIKQEANILNLNHENIIKILMIDQLKGFVIMEQFDGKCLQYIIDCFEISLIHRMWILQDVIKALNFCHQHKICHSDLKPQNIMVVMNKRKLRTPNRKYICKLFDFGCSARLDENAAGQNIGGTIRYMAPEMLQRNEISLSADIYSFGIIMWQLKERRYPYQEIDNNDIIIYNVVKNGLRPNTVLDEFVVSSHVTEDLKLCKAIINRPHLRSFVSKSEFAENINRNIITSPLTSIVCKIPGKSLQKKRMSHNYKLNVNARKRLCFTDKKLKKSTKLLDSKERLQQLFQDTCTRPIEHILYVEKEYVNLYTKCWHADQEVRPHSYEIRKTIEHLISSVFPVVSFQ